MAMNEITGTKKLFALVAGLSYGVLGILQVLAGAGMGSDGMASFNITGGIIDGCMLLVASAVFLAGARRMLAGDAAGEAFLNVGIMLSLLYAAVYVLLFAGDLLMAYAIGSEDYAGWAPAEGIAPAIYAAVLPLLGYAAWKERIGLGTLSKAGR